MLSTWGGLKHPSGASHTQECKSTKDSKMLSLLAIQLIRKIFSKVLQVQLIYHLNINMTKRIIKLLWVIAVLIVAVLFLLTAYTAWMNKTLAEENNKSETLWQLVDKMDSLRDLKSECADNLWIADSAKFLKGMTWYCDSRDAEIIELRNQINKMQKKDYEGLM